jgi:hypothetical protein
MASCLISALLLLALSSSVTASPLPTRDQNPLLAGFGLPMPLPARVPEDTWSLAADFNWGSSALMQGSDDEFLVVDAETRELRLTFERRLGERWTMGLQLPYRYTGGGNLDSFIDTWHDVFSLPEGARPHQSKDRMKIRYWRRGTTLLEFGTQTNGFGDAALTLGYQLFDAPDSAMRAGLSIKVPTGEEHPLNSSGATDISAVVAGERMLGERVSLFGQMGATWLGEGDLLAAQQRDVVWSGQAGLAWRPLRSIELTLQFDAHTRVFDDTELEFFGDALILTAGGAYHFNSGWALNIAVSEDIEVERSPDVVFVIGVSRAYRGR